MSKKIHPSSENKKGISNRLQGHNRHDPVNPLPIAVSSSPNRETLTVWKRSSMSFHGTDGFTVYDHQGRLAFRVDNYSRNGWSCTSLAGGSNGGCGGGGGGGGALVLMDGSGRPLLTLKSQIFSIHSQWNGCIYSEDNNGSSKKNRRIFMMRRPSTNAIVFRPKQNKKTKCEAEVFFNHLAEPEESDGFWKLSRQPDYEIDGTFWNRDCKIRTRSGEVAAKITRKKTGAAATMNGSCSSSSSTIMLSEEVFTLVVNPGFDSQFMMAFVVILDRICFKPFFNPLICS